MLSLPGIAGGTATAMEMNDSYQSQNTDSDAGGGNEVIGIGGDDSRNSKLQEKIDVVLQILTLLESTMSSAEGVHQKRKSNCLSRISQLQLEIDKLRQQMSLDEEQFQDVNQTIGSNIRQYMASENILRTVEERSEEDNYVLPDLDPKTDMFIDQYLNGKQEEWLSLRSIRDRLNCDTQKNAFQKELLVRRFKLLIPMVSADQVNQRAAGAANALNTFRGKKYISGNQSFTMERFFTMTCYKNETAAVKYVEKNFEMILKDVVRKEYNNCIVNSLFISELATDDTFDFASVLEMTMTIHVQRKPKDKSDSNTPSMPKRITLYQFDDGSSRRHSQVTTFNVESTTVSDVNDNHFETGVADVSSLVPPNVVNRQKQEQAYASKPDSVRRNSTFNPNNYSRQQIAVKTSKILSFIGLEDENVSNDGAADNNNADQSNQLRETEPPISTLAAQESSESLNAEDDFKEVDGIVLHEWAWFYVQQKGIERFTETQKELVDSFKLQGDILYKGVANSGKTTATILGLVNNLNAELFKPQALIVTPNPRSAKLIQKLTSIEADHYMIMCKRYDEVISQKGQSKSKAFKRPSCHVVVGSAQEMCELTTKSLVNTERINYLVLYKMDEIVGPESARKSIFTDIRKLLYALNAAVKVIVICKTNVNARMCNEMQEICEYKLRSKILLEETVDIEEFLLGRRRMKSGDGDRNFRTDSLLKSVTPVNIGVPVNRPTASESSDDEDDPPPQDSCSDNDDEEETPWRTFIPLDAVQLLGLNVGYQLPETDQVEVAHFYANVEDGSDDSKADVISLLDLEEDKAIIFCNSPDKAEWLSTKLRQKQLWPQVLHEDLPRKEQRVILESFRQGSFCRVLIVTDFFLTVSFDSADVVLNFDLPKTHTLYLNRAAFAFRQINSDTGSNSQADRKGIVVSLVVEGEMTFINELEEAVGIKVHNCED